MDKSECCGTGCFLGELLRCLLLGMMMTVGQLYEYLELCDVPGGSWSAPGLSFSLL